MWQKYEFDDKFYSKFTKIIRKFSTSRALERGFPIRNFNTKKKLIIHGNRISSRTFGISWDSWDFLGFCPAFVIPSPIPIPNFWKIDPNPNPNPKILKNRSQSQSQSQNSEKSIPIPIPIPKSWDWDWDPMGLGSQCRPLVSRTSLRD